MWEQITEKVYRWLGNRPLIKGQEFHMNHTLSMSNNTMLLTKSHGAGYSNRFLERMTCK